MRNKHLSSFLEELTYENISRPEGIWEYGNKEQLLRFKPYFREDMESGKMGSGPCWDLLTMLRPRNWYAAHMHCRFDANVQHSDNESTRFVALDKCLPNRKFLDFLDIGDNSQNPPEVKYDLEWLTVLHLTNNLLNVNRNYTKLPLQPGPDDPQDNVQRFEFTPSPEEMNAVLKKLNGDLTVPKNFTQTVPAYDPQRDGRNFRNLYQQVTVELNPQTTDFCSKLSLDDPLFLAAKFSRIELTTSTVNLSRRLVEKESEKVLVLPRAPLASFLPQPKFGNDEEIDLDELENDEEVEKNPGESIEKKKTNLDESVEEQKSIEIEKSAVALIETPAIIQQTLIDVGVVASPPNKKFKRRNQEIYTANDDE